MFVTFVLLDSQVEDQKLSSETNELVLDGGFVVPKIVSNNGLAAEELVSSNEFLAPEINSFGRLFRSSNPLMIKDLHFFS